MRPPVALPRLDTSTISFQRSRRSRTATIKIEAKGIVIDTVKTSAMTPTINGYARAGIARRRSIRIPVMLMSVEALWAFVGQVRPFAYLFRKRRPQHFDLSQEH